MQRGPFEEHAEALGLRKRFGKRGVGVERKALWLRASEEVRKRAADPEKGFVMVVGFRKELEHTVVP